MIYHIIWCDVMWYGMKWYDIYDYYIWNDVIWYDVMWHEMIWYDYDYIISYEALWCNVLWSNMINMIMIYMIMLYDAIYNWYKVYYNIIYTNYVTFVGITININYWTPSARAVLHWTVSRGFTSIYPVLSRDSKLISKSRTSTDTRDYKFTAIS